MVKVDRPAGHGQPLPGLFIGDLRLLVEYLHHTPAAGDGPCEHHHHHGYHHQRHEDFRHIGEKRNEVAGEQAPLKHIVSADPQHGYNGAAHEQKDQRHKHHHKAEGLFRHGLELFIAAGEFFLFHILPHEGFHHPDGVQILLHHQVQVVSGPLQGGEERPHPPQHQHHTQHQQRDHHQEHLAQPCADDKGHHQGRHQHHRGSHQHPHTHHQGHLQAAHIVGQPGNQRGRGKMLNVGKGKPLHLPILGGPEIGAEAHAGLGGKHRRPYAQRQGHQGH